MEHVDVGQLGDDELIGLITDAARDRARLTGALEELFRRMREEAEPHRLAYVEAVIDRLRWTFEQDDEDDSPGSGVREPRRPPPDRDASAIRLAC